MSAAAKTFSGKFVVRVQPRLHARLSRHAKESGVSLNHVCEMAMDAYLNNALGASSIGEAKLAQQLRDAGVPIEAIVLFGSTARGEAGATSDVDLLLVVPPQIPLSRALYSTWDTLDLPAKWSPQFVHAPSNVADAGSLWCECAIDGVVLWASNAVASHFLATLRRAIAVGELTRKVLHGQGYWIHHAQ